MTDKGIIELYWRRDERAIEETDTRYGVYCLSLSLGILSNRADAEESVNDTYLAAWNTMPPTRPDSLKAYLARICRSISVSTLRAKHAQKRGGGEAALALDELGEVIADRDGDVQKACEARELGEAISAYLVTRRERERTVFVARYFYCMPIKDIARRTKTNENTVKTLLRRTREGLCEYLRGEGLL